MKLKTWQVILLAFVFYAVLLIIGVASAKATTYEAPFIYSESNGDSLRWVLVVDGVDTDSAKVNAATNELAPGVWSDTITVGDHNSLWIYFRFFAGTDTAFGGYILNQRANVIAVDDDSTGADTLVADLASAIDTLRNQDDWVAHQTTADSLYDSLLIVLDSLEALESWVSQLTASDNIGINWNDVDNKTASVDLSATTTFAVDISTTVGAVSAGGITAASFAANSITASALATDAIDEFWEYDTTLIGVAGGLGLRLMDAASNAEYTADNAGDYKATGYSTHSAANVWAVVTRILTALDEDNTTIDLDGSTIGTATNLTTNNDKTGYALSTSGVDALWDEDTTGHGTASSFAVMLKDTSAYQGAAAGITAAAVADAVWDEDTIGHYVQGKFGYEATGSGAGSPWSSAQRDSILAAVQDANVGDKVWDADTTGHYVVGKYGYEATSGAASVWSTAQRDSVLNTIEDANKANFKATGFSTHNAAGVYTEFTSGSNEDVFKATGFSSHTSADVADAVWDELLSTHSNAGSAGDIIVDSLDALVSAAGSSPWNSTTRDSVLNAIEDANKSNFADVATGFSTHSVADIYNYFLSGTNEEAFFGPDSAYLQPGEATKIKDTVGTITASVDTVAIARSVWNEAQAGHVTAGTFGLYLDQAISSISGLAGSGAYTWQVQVMDTSTAPDSAVVCRVFVNNLAQNATPYQAYTDNNGLATFYLDAGTWVKSTTEPGYDPVLDTFSITATGTDTLSLNSGTGGRTTIALQLSKPSGVRYANAKITVDFVAVNDSFPLYVGDTILPADSRNEETFTADNEGLMSLAVWANEDITGDSTYYRFVVRDVQRRKVVDAFNVWIPSADTTVWIQNLTTWGRD